MNQERRNAAILQLAELYGMERMEGRVGPWLEAIARILDEYDGPEPEPEAPGDRARQELRELLGAPQMVNADTRDVDQGPSLQDNPIRKRREEELQRRIEAGEVIEPRQAPRQSKEAQMRGALGDMNERLMMTMGTKLDSI